jgi:phospholipid/cholesterol/gamma-HCH transport system permease protein
MIVLAGRTIACGATPPYSYGEELLGQLFFALRLCWFPLLISTVAFGAGAPGLRASSFAPFVTTAVVAGVAGTAITADLGSRKIREELDALDVLRVDPIENLVVPRLGALMLASGLLDVYAMVIGVAAELLRHQSPGDLLLASPSVLDLAGSVIRCALFGAIVAVVCSYKGMTASGGARGVGRAVNQATATAFVGVFAFDLAFTQTLLGTPGG